MPWRHKATRRTGDQPPVLYAVTAFYVTPVSGEAPHTHYKLVLEMGSMKTFLVMMPFQSDPQLYTNMILKRLAECQAGQ